MIAASMNRFKQSRLALAVKHAVGKGLRWLVRIGMGQELSAENAADRMIRPCHPQTVTVTVQWSCAWCAW